MKSVKRNKGFSLVELLVVIAIISILTMVTVSQFTTARQRARDAQRKGDLSNLAKSLQMYYTDYGKFPDPDTINPLLVNGGEFKDGDYIYMKVVPKEKTLTSRPFCYKVDDETNPIKYGLFAQLEVTSDSDCVMNGSEGSYGCDPGGGEVKYCYGIVSPNTKLTVDGGLE